MENFVTWNIPKGHDTQIPGTPSFWVDPPLDLRKNTDLSTSKPDAKYTQKYFSFLTNYVRPRIKLVLWAGLSWEQPCQSCTLFTVLVLHEASNLSIVRLPILLVCYLNYISGLVVHTLWDEMQTELWRLYTLISHQVRRNPTDTNSNISSRHSENWSERAELYKNQDFFYAWEE